MLHLTQPSSARVFPSHSLQERAGDSSWRCKRVLGSLQTSVLPVLPARARQQKRGRREAGCSSVWQAASYQWMRRVQFIERSWSCPPPTNSWKSSALPPAQEHLVLFLGACLLTKTPWKRLIQSQALSPAAPLWTPAVLAHPPSILVPKDLPSPCKVHSFVASKFCAAAASLTVTIAWGKMGQPYVGSCGIMQIFCLWKVPN